MRRVGHLYQRWSDKGIKTKKGDERGSMKEKKSQEEVRFHNWATSSRRQP